MQTSTHVKATLNALTVSSIIGLSLAATQAHAAVNLERALNVCKYEVQRQFAGKDDTLRVKFKSINGPRSAKQLRLKVFGEEANAYGAICTIDTRSYSKATVAKTGKAERNVAGR